MRLPLTFGAKVINGVSLGLPTLIHPFVEFAASESRRHSLFKCFFFNLGACICFRSSMILGKFMDILANHMDVHFPTKMVG